MNEERRDLYKTLKLVEDAKQTIREVEKDHALNFIEFMSEYITDNFDITSDEWDELIERIRNLA